MKLTKALKQWAVQNCGVAPDASDDEYRKAIGSAIADGSLSTEKFTDLTKPDDGTPDLQKMISESVKEGNSDLQKQLDDLKSQMNTSSDQQDDEPVDNNKSTDDDNVGTTIEDLQKQINELKSSSSNQDQGISPKNFLAKTASLGSGSQPRVKSAAENYSTTKTAAVHGAKHSVLKGSPATYLGRQLDHPSELDKAISGAYLKWAMNSQGSNVPRPATPQLPFGGLKESGIGRENAIEGMDVYLETKSVSVAI